MTVSSGLQTQSESLTRSRDRKQTTGMVTGTKKSNVRETGIHTRFVGCPACEEAHSLI